MDFCCSHICIAWIKSRRHNPQCRWLCGPPSTKTEKRDTKARTNKRGTFFPRAAMAARGPGMAEGWVSCMLCVYMPVCVHVHSSFKHVPCCNLSWSDNLHCCGGCGCPRPWSFFWFHTWTAVPTAAGDWLLEEHAGDGTLIRKG